MSPDRQSHIPPSPKPLRLVFFGSGAFGLPTLQRLASDHEVSAVVTQPDKPAGRKRTPAPTPIGEWTAEHLPTTRLIKPQNVNAPEVMEELRSIDTGSISEHRGAWVVIAFGQKLSHPLLHDRFAINLHASLLPRWRGAAPINHAILAGDDRTGNSVITLADRMDAGLILGRSERDITTQTTAGELHDLLADDGPDLVTGVLADFASDQLRPESQDESKVTLAGKLAKSSGFLDLTSCDAIAARCCIHGLNPWPGVTVGFRGEPLKIHRAAVVPGNAENAPGTIVDPATGTVACAHGSLLSLIEVQPAGKRPMSFEAFANGASVEQGEELCVFEPTKAT